MVYKVKAMIIVCGNCHASFLVPSSLFHGASHLVRCGKCGKVWREFSSGKTDADAPSSPPADSWLFSSAKEGTPPLSSPDTADATPLPPVPKLTFSDVKTFLSSLLKTVVFVLLTLLSLSVLGFFTGHRYIAQMWPSTEAIYRPLGLSLTAAPDETLLIQNITSERRYADGAMQLIVNGEIKNISQKPQALPLLNVDALGPDGKIIQSWHIKPSAATLGADSVLPFSSSILSPEETVVAVNLSFVETPHAQP